MLANRGGCGKYLHKLLKDLQRFSEISWTIIANNLYGGSLVKEGLVAKHGNTNFGNYYISKHSSSIPTPSKYYTVIVSCNDKSNQIFIPPPTRLPTNCQLQNPLFFCSQYVYVYGKID